MAGSFKAIDPSLLSHHSEVLAALQAAVYDREGILILTGEEKIGRTAVINVLRDRLQRDDALVVTVVYPSPALGAFLSEWAARRQRAVHGKRLLLVIDEAHNLKPGLLENVAPLLWGTDNSLSSDCSPCSVLLVGQDGFESSVLDEGLVPRITGRYSLSSLTKTAVADYEARRLAPADAGVYHLARSLPRTLHRSADGVVRLVNVICGPLKSTALRFIMLRRGLSTVRSPQHVLGGSVSRMSTLWALKERSADAVRRLRSRGVRRAAAVLAGVLVVALGSGVAVHRFGADNNNRRDPTAVEALPARPAAEDVALPPRAPVEPPVSDVQPAPASPWQEPPEHVALPPRAPVAPSLPEGQAGPASPQREPPNRLPVTKAPSRPRPRENRAIEQAIQTPVTPTPAPRRGGHDGDEARDPSAIIDWLLKERSPSRPPVVP